MDGQTGKDIFAYDMPVKDSEKNFTTGDTLLMRAIRFMEAAYVRGRFMMTAKGRGMTVREVTMIRYAAIVFLLWIRKPAG